MLLLALTAIGMLTLLAWLSARATVYSVTSHRVIIKGGVALPVTVNLPFAIAKLNNASNPCSSTASQSTS